MNRQDFEREATLRMLPTCSSAFADSAEFADYISQTVQRLADRLFADPAPTLFIDGVEQGKISNGDRSGITFDELHRRGEICTRTKQLAVSPLCVIHLAELAGASRRYLMSFWHVGNKTAQEIHEVLIKYGYEGLK